MYCFARYRDRGSNGRGRGRGGSGGGRGRGGGGDRGGGSSWGRGGSSYGGGGFGAGMNNMRNQLPGGRLRRPNWDMNALHSFRKDFYVPHADVANR